MWFLPSIGRPDRCQEALDCIIKAGCSTPGLVVVDGDTENHAAYMAMRLPPGWSVHWLPERLGGVARVWNWCYREHPSLDWYGMLTDDLHVRTPGWDTALIEKATAKYIASANDLWQAPTRMHGATVIGGELLRTVGYFVPTGMNHNYVDEMWEQIGEGFQVWEVMQGVVTEHMHPGCGKAPVDATYAKNMVVGPDGSVTYDTPTFRADKLVWERWTEFEKPLVYQRLARFFGRTAARKIPLTGRKVYIATPAHDGVLDTLYQRSMIATVAALQHHGVYFEHTVLPGESLLMRARNNLVHAFLKSSCDTLAFIDADMGWKAEDFLRVLAVSKDIAGGAGPRKVDPPTYCVRLAVGTNIPHCPETGWLEAQCLGTGFIFIRRHVLEKMVVDFKDQEFEDDDRVVPGLFNTLIEDRRLWSEDFTFCRRAAKSGFKTYVDPSIELEHAGRKVWKGSLASQLTTTPQPGQLTAAAAATPLLPIRDAAD